MQPDAGRPPFVDYGSRMVRILGSSRDVPHKRSHVGKHRAVLTPLSPPISLMHEGDVRHNSKTLHLDISCRRRPAAPEIGADERGLSAMPTHRLCVARHHCVEDLPPFDKPDSNQARNHGISALRLFIIAVVYRRWRDRGILPFLPANTNVIAAIMTGGAGSCCSVCWI